MTILFCGYVDSGPVVLPAGAAAGIVSIRTYATFQQYETASTLLHALDGMAIPLQHNGQRRQLFGALPMANAFLAWSACMRHRHARICPSMAGVFHHLASTDAGPKR